MAEAVRYLAALCHRRIDRVGGPDGLRHSAVRGRRPPSPARCTNRACVPGGRLATPYSGEEGARATRSLLLAPERPTAIVYDVMSVAGAAVTAELG